MRKVIVAIACLLGVAVHSTKVIAITIQPATTTSHSSIVYVSDGGGHYGGRVVNTNDIDGFPRRDWREEAFDCPGRGGC
jgi:hypothetical protein